MDKYRHYARITRDADPKRRCHRCYGNGRATCPTCGGQGRVMKGKDRLSRALFDRCNACYGTRTCICANCSGEGFI